MSLSSGEWVADARKKGSQFTDRFKRMITHSGYIPDLAGVGNLIITSSGEVCLVDINNISPVSNDATIPLDEKGYPVCDKSIEALSLIEEKIVGRPIDMEEKIYQQFLSSQRKRMVQDCYERELKRDPSLAGKIEIEFTIGTSGRVDEAFVASNRMGSDAVGDCIVSRLKRWRFPKPGGGSVTVSFPFIFTPSS